MLDLVKHESERIGSRALEPACGSGSFLVPVLVLGSLAPCRARFPGFRGSRAAVACPRFSRSCRTLQGTAEAVVLRLPPPAWFPELMIGFANESDV